MLVTWIEYSGVRADTLNTAFCSFWFGVFKKGMRVTWVPYIIASVLRYKQYQPLDSTFAFRLTSHLGGEALSVCMGTYLVSDSNYILNKYFYADSVVALPYKCYLVNLHIKLNFWAVFIKGNLDKGYFTSDWDSSPMRLHSSFEVCTLTWPGEI